MISQIPALIEEASINKEGGNFPGNYTSILSNREAMSLYGVQIFMKVSF